ncbi:TIGR00303 family protein [Scytonema sp. UIC 10036]|uniref:nicotinate mononucleotide-dependent phosphoribosyltransferase CobT n=1 Tax=Scytonema sp. UIC 10036 TaxID=2304196 RepID=UPI0012DA24BC|nr:TIGR00303 family protein [Scytonema sp. UIC 10036]MUG99507.1 TIGR00303 family protein [Scytonema sp. UIC 10036]
MIRIYTQIEQAREWITKYRGCLPVFACVLGFTDTCLIPGISAAGSTPEDRKYTACADAEFLYYGTGIKPKYPLPSLLAGVSPVFITRAVVETLKIPVYVFNAGLPQSPPVPVIDLGGSPAKCLSQGKAMDIAIVHHLLKQGMEWGERLANHDRKDYYILSECVVGGTTTALAILTGLGIQAVGKVNSSHPVCNHAQKWTLVQTGLSKARLGIGNWEMGAGKESSQTLIQNPKSKIQNFPDPLQLVAAVGDPMQVAVAGMTLALSRSCGVLLAGGTQMLAVYALTCAIAQVYDLPWRVEEVIVGTTRWVAEDSTGGTVELAELIGWHSSTPNEFFTPPLLATELSFAKSRYEQLRAYEKGFVKEGVGAGGACIAAYLYQGWQQHQLLQAIEQQIQSAYGN